MRYTKIRNWLAAITGVFVMMNIYGCSDGFKYSRYSSQDPELNLTVDYIAGWHVIEHRGEDDINANVLFFEDKPGDIFKAKVSINAIYISKSSINPPTAEALADSITASTLKSEGSNVISRTKMKFLGVEAINLLFSCKALDKIYAVDSRLIPTKERMIIFKKGDKFYILRYENKEEDFEKLTKAFAHIAKSLRFKSSD